MFSVTYTADGFARANVDATAVSTMGLGNLISGVAARLKDADLEDLEFSPTTLADIFEPPRSKKSLGKFSAMALAMYNLGYALETPVFVARKGSILVLRDADGEGFKSIKNKMLSL